MKQRISFLICACLLMLMSAMPSMGQEATPEPEIEQPSLTEIFASLPQTRAKDGGFVVGEPDAPITIIEFVDYACPHCQTYRTVIDQVVVDYVATGAAKLELRIFPTAGGQVTYYVGQVLECAEEQRAGTFWDAYELLYEYAATNRYNENAPRLLANEFDLNYVKMLRCSANAQQVMNDIVLAEALGVTGTPGIRVRYDDGVAVPVTMDGVEITRGGVAFEVLARFIQAANGIELTPEPSGELI